MLYEVITATTDGVDTAGAMAALSVAVEKAAGLAPAWMADQLLRWDEAMLDYVAAKSVVITSYSIHYTKLYEPRDESPRPRKPRTLGRRLARRARPSLRRRRRTTLASTLPGAEPTRGLRRRRHRVITSYSIHYTKLYESVMSRNGLKPTNSSNSSGPSYARRKRWNPSVALPVGWPTTTITCSVSSSGMPRWH